MAAKKASNHRTALVSGEGISLPSILRSADSTVASLVSSNMGITLSKGSTVDDDYDEEEEARPLFLKQQSVIDNNADICDRSAEARALIEEASRIPRAPSRYKTTSASTFESSKLPPLPLPKSDKYFGDSSRLNFYNTYRELNQQRRRFVGNDEASADIISVQRDLDRELDDLSADCPWSRLGYEDDLDDPPTVSGKNPNSDDDDDDSTDCDTHRENVKENEIISDGAESISALSISSFGTALTEGDRTVKSYGANSPRARYLAGCLENNIPPRCGMLLRGKETTSLWLDHLGMGDRLGMLLAKGLQDMPLITSINLTDNNLTDISLKPLIDAIAGNPSITELFLSQNKIDSEASEALANYLSSTDCTLTKLVMRKADIDDGECHHFVEVLKYNQTLTYIDMSENLLGKDENLNAVNPDIITGGESLAMLLTDGDCVLTHLIISWNMVRMEGAVDISNSLRGLKNLIHLDISFNSFASEAGGVLGNALLDNRVLEELLVSSNNLEGTATFAICVGARESKSLKYLNIDGNPIGEAGARILMTLPVSRGNTLKFSARDCDVAIKYPNCLYNSTAPAGDYRLDLSNPYQQAVCLDLLDAVAKNSSYHFGDCRYFEKIDDVKNYNQLVFSHFSEPISVKHITLRSKREVTDLAINMQVSEDIEACRQRFFDFDTENKGELSTNQFFSLIDDLGFVFTHKMKAMAMSIYDSDHSGSIEYEEYMDFISKMKSDAQYRIRDIETTARTCLSTSGAPSRYMPPRQGIIHLEVLKSYIATDDSRALTSEQCDNLLRSAQNTSHAAKVINYGAEGDKLRFAESLELFKVLEKENNNSTATLSVLLPQCVNSSDAKNLAFSSGGDQEKIRMRVETALGAAYRPIMGLADGYYALDLKKEKDRNCLQKLFEIGSAISKHRRKHLLGDLSQDGNWSCFRNEYMANKEVSITAEFMTPMPESGKIEFDFMGSQLPLKSTVTLTDRKFVSFLWEIQVANAKNNQYIYDNLNEMKEACAKSLSIPGISAYHQPDVGRMVEVQRYMNDKLYSKLNERSLHYEHALKREVASLLVAKPLTQLQRQAASDLKSSKVVVKDGHASIINRSKEAGEDESDNDSFSGDDDAIVDESIISTVAANERKSMGHKPREPASRVNKFLASKHQPGSESTRQLLDELYENHPKHAATCLAQLERFVSCFSPKHLLCRHLAVLMLLFLRGTCKKTDWGTYRVELIIAMFSRLKDVHNFELVLAQLNTEEVAMVYARIGILNTFNPLKPEGGYCLDLGVWEERQVAKILIHFACVEPGANWFYQEYTFDRRQEGIPGWELPVTWLSEEGLPAKGLLTLMYYSGGGLRLQGCNPTIKVREAALSLTLTHPSYIQYEKRCNVSPIKFPHVCKILEVNAMLVGAGIMWSYYNNVS